MDAYLSLLVVILAATFQLAKTNIQESKEPSVMNTSDHLIRVILDSSGFSNNSSPKARSPRGDGSIPSWCSSKMCLSFCCSVGEARHEGVCVKDNISTSQMKIEIKTDKGAKQVSVQNFHQVTYDPCEYDWMVTSVLKKFYVLENRSIGGLDVDKNLLWNQEHYCLFRNRDSFVYFAKVCRPFIRKGAWEIFCAIVVILIMILIFIGYTVVPGLRNLHGMIFRSYIASYFVTALCALAVEFTTEVRTHAYWYILFGFWCYLLEILYHISFPESTGRYCGFSCILWLNAMSFNVWRSFRSIRSIDQRRKQKFIWYAIYAWGSPVVILPSLIFAEYYVPFLRNGTEGHAIKIWTSVGCIATIYMSNAFFYTLTALAIRQHKTDTAQLANGVSKHHEIVEQWFNLYVKLFLMMGGHIVAWIIWFLWSTPLTTHAVGTVEVLQAILIFFIFVWKDNIKRSFCEQFTAMYKKPRFSSHV